MEKDTRGILEVRPDAELKDYSGPFRSDLRYTDFSKEYLAKMYKMTTEYFMAIWNAWMAFVGEKMGSAAVEEAHTYLWDDLERLCAPIAKMKEDWINIEGNDIEALMKHSQMDPTSCAGKMFSKTFEMPSKDCGIVTYNRCFMVDLLEDSQPDHLREICENMCPPSYRRTAEMLNPDIEVTYLSIPPRKSKDDHCCQVKLTYKSKGSK